MPSFSFATFLIVCPTSFFLGIVYAQFPYDYPILWSSVAAAPSHLDLVEAHLKLLHNAPNLIVRILHVMTFLGLLGLIIKLYKPTESNMLFDGGSLVLYLVAVIVYVTNIVKGLRIVSFGDYGLSDLSGLDATGAGIVENIAAGGGGSVVDDVDPGMISIVGREDNLKILAASNTILALVLLGVLVLQAGQWYAERSDARERKKFEEAEAKEAADAAAAAAAEFMSSSTAVKRQTSGRESKKAR